jgi:hypothetical protein
MGLGFQMFLFARSWLSAVDRDRTAQEEAGMMAGLSMSTGPISLLGGPAKLRLPPNSVKRPLRQNVLLWAAVLLASTVFFL